jgi:uncharacterized protein
LVSDTPDNAVIFILMNSYRGKHNHRFRRLAELILDSALLNGLIATWSYRCGLHGKLGVSLHDVFVAKEKPLRVPSARD